MNKAMPIGISDYKELVQKDYYFVDKTLMIKDFLDYRKKVTLITRPRRFGKKIEYVNDGRIL
ncbi:MAG: AAA family ATPase [Erysipelotrichaceae bacterium]|nr:AAA family ATPase [Erysipelotrichaceae bacterium]